MKKFLGSQITKNDIENRTFSHFYAKENEVMRNVLPAEAELR